MKHRPTRFRALILLGVVFAMVAAACTSSDTAEDSGLVTITARCKATSVEVGRCNNLLQGVVAANDQLAADGDDRRVQVQIIQDNADWGDYRTEFELASDAGQAPDIIVSGHEDIGTWATSGIITDVTDLLGDYSEFDDVIESLWLSTELNGRRWGVPQDAEARPLYYRRDLLVELGWTQAEADGLAARLDRKAWQTPPIFATIQSRGEIADGEMFRVFNMGLGMVLACDPSKADRVIENIPSALVVGQVVGVEDERRVIL